MPFRASLEVSEVIANTHCSMISTVSNVVYAQDITPADDDVDMDSDSYDNYLNNINTFIHANQAFMVLNNNEIKNRDPYYNNTLDLGSNSTIHQQIIDRSLIHI